MSNDSIPPCSPSAKNSIRHLLTAYDLRWSHVVCESKLHKYKKCRLAIYWMLHCRGWSYAQIGRLCSRDASTILYHIKIIKSESIGPVKDRIRASAKRPIGRAV